MIEHFETDWGNPGSYSQAVKSGGLIYVCGQVGIDHGGTPAAIEDQTRRALERLLEIIQRAGGAKETVLKINGYLASLDDFEAYDSVYRTIIDTDPKPARTTIEVSRFEPWILVEIDAVAAVKEAVR